MFKPRIFYYVNYGYKNYEAIVNTPETNNRLGKVGKTLFIQGGPFSTVAGLQRGPAKYNF